MGSLCEAYKRQFRHLRTAIDSNSASMLALQGIRAELAEQDVAVNRVHESHDHVQARLKDMQRRTRRSLR